METVIFLLLSVAYVALVCWIVHESRKARPNEKVETYVLTILDDVLIGKLTTRFFYLSKGLLETLELRDQQYQALANADTLAELRSLARAHQLGLNLLDEEPAKQIARYQAELAQLSTLIMCIGEGRPESDPLVQAVVNAPG